ncbi:MAG: TlpA family protein disulfide reductase [Gammaproteobacteria bacterium]|nr:TlpA family protein disulfide reductase [Gammaproteobacteria bacterium]
MLSLATSAAFAESAPDFKLAGQNGAVNLNLLRGKVVYVDFWASWCGPCRKSFPWLNQMSSRYGKKGLIVVGINLDKERALADGFLKETPAQFTIAFDPTGGTADAYQVKGMPSSFLIDKKGNIIYKHQGFRDQDTAALEKKIKAAVEGS